MLILGRSELSAERLEFFDEFGIEGRLCICDIARNIAGVALVDDVARVALVGSRTPHIIDVHLV